MYIALVKGGGGVPKKFLYRNACTKMLAQTQDEQKIMLRKIAHCSFPGGGGGGADSYGVNFDKKKFIAHARSHFVFFEF